MTKEDQLLNRSEIIRMAREAGAMFDHMTWVERDLAPVFERFAALVAAAEREDIIKTAQDMYFWDDSERLIKAIRARGNT